jgi:UDP-N-acetylglucosamine:LPS N-acetylglucosamine transferase
MVNGAPYLVSVDMGYGHLRAAWALADRLGVPVQRADCAPLADAADRRVWWASREGYERLSRLSQHPVFGPPFRALLQRLTAIHPSGTASDASRPDGATRFLDRRIERGFGAALCRHLEASGDPLVTTFYAPALAADRFTTATVFCIVTDSEVHRVWAPAKPGDSRIRYLVPAPGTAARLIAYGVPETNITVTGFPLPGDLEDRAEELLDRRLRRLAGRGDGPPLVTFAVGGAGAQAARARCLLESLEGPLRRGEVRLALVAGLRKGLARRFRRWIAKVGVDHDPEAVTIVEADSFETLYRRFNRLLERTDALWTKPSELSFYAALGLPLILDDPVGDHERANARWVALAGGGLQRPTGRDQGTTLTGWLAHGRLAECATNGFAELPRGGTNTIARIVFRSS